LAPLQTDDEIISLDQVKRRSKEALLNSSDPIVTMKMIDSIQGLGIGHHLEDEINVQLGRVCDWDASRDLFATSLQFRLLRHNGWSTCSGTLLLPPVSYIHATFQFLINVYFV
jgi:(3S)-linalool synthase